MTTELPMDVIKAHNNSLKLASGAGCEKNLSAAIIPMRQAAVGGHPHAQCNLGFLYATGDGIKKDIPKAVRWLTAAAETGEVQAMFNLAQILETGRISTALSGRHCRLGT